MHKLPKLIQKEIDDPFVLDVGHPVSRMIDGVYKFLSSQATVITPITPKNIVESVDCFDRLFYNNQMPERRLAYCLDKQTMLKISHAYNLCRYIKIYQKFYNFGPVFKRCKINNLSYPISNELMFYKSGFHPSEEVKTTVVHALRFLLPEVTFKPISANCFPFVEDGFDIVVGLADEYSYKWVKIGCGGLVSEQLMSRCNRGRDKAFVLFLNIDRMAMIRYQVPDVRLLWNREIDFCCDKFGKYKPEIIYKPIYKDISFWLDETLECYVDLAGNWSLFYNFCDIIRDSTDDCVEEVILHDRFVNNGKTSLCYRLMYRGTNSNLTNSIVNYKHEKLRQDVKVLGVEIR